MSGDSPLDILHDVSFVINQGESVAITGSSGSGKTTLLSMLAGLDKPTGGEISIDGACISGMNEDERADFRAANVGFVFQSFHLLQGLTALDNVSLPLSLTGDRDAEAKASQWLVDVGLSKRIHHKPSQLSGGEQQRVAVARAFATRPALLFADEPTGNLDAETGGRIIDLLFQLNEKNNTTLVLVTHEERLALRCERQLRLADGKIHEDALP